jgi:hypothetical protein
MLIVLSWTLLNGFLQGLHRCISFFIFKYIKNLFLFIEVGSTHGNGHLHMEERIVNEALARGRPLFRIVVEHVSDQLDGIFTRILNNPSQALWEILRKFET